MKQGFFCKINKYKITSFYFAHRSKNKDYLKISYPQEFRIPQ